MLDHLPHCPPSRLVTHGSNSDAKTILCSKGKDVFVYSTRRKLVISNTRIHEYARLGKFASAKKKRNCKNETVQKWKGARVIKCRNEQSRICQLKREQTFHLAVRRKSQIRRQRIRAKSEMGVFQISVRGVSASRSSTHMARQSARKKKPNSSRVTTPVVDQALFVAPRRSVRSRPPAWSAPTKKQQTITQMNPFFSIFHPEMLPTDLAYENDDPTLSSIESPRPRKRQRLTPTENTIHRPSGRARIQTRSNTVLTDQMAEHSPSRKNARSQGAAHLRKVLKTPIPRDKVIPSSQSPAETPTSVRSRRDGYDTFRSPLQERSVNITPRRSSLRGSALKTTKKESTSRREAYGRSYPTTPAVPFKLPPGVNKSSSHSHAPIKGSQSAAAPETMRVVLDSEKENLSSQASTNMEPLGLNDQDTGGDAGGFDVGAETQEAIASLQSEIFAHTGDTPFQTSSQVKQIDCSEDKASSSEVSNSAQKQQYGQQATSSFSSNQAHFHANETSNLASASALPQSEASSLSRESITQNSPIRQHHYHRTAKQKPSIPSSSPPSISPPPQPQHQISTSSAATTIPAQALPLPRALSHTNPIPPSSHSQATTINTTQASSILNHKRKPSTTTTIIPDSSPPELPASSTKPPPSQLTLSIPSSSPLPNQLEEGDLGAYEWRNGPLHESQLLPESQLQGTLARPPEGWEEEWEVEDEDEEDGL